MIILSIDSGIEKTGFAVFDIVKERKFKYINSGLVKTSAKLGVEYRLLQIYKAIDNLVVKYKPTVIVMEQLFFAKNIKTAIHVSQAQGTILLLAAQIGIRIDFLTPLQIKQTVTGYGFADKKSVKKMICLLINENIKIEDDDQSDAIACGLAYVYSNCL